MSQSAPRRRHPRRLETRPARPQPAPPGQHRPLPDRPRRRAEGAHRARRRDRHHHHRRQARIRDLRRAGRVRTRADLRTHHRGARLSPRPRPQGRTAIQDDPSQATPRNRLNGPVRHQDRRPSAQSSGSPTKRSTATSRQPASSDPTGSSSSPRANANHDKNRSVRPGAPAKRATSGTDRGRQRKSRAETTARLNRGVRTSFAPTGSPDGRQGSFTSPRGHVPAEHYADGSGGEARFPPARFLSRLVSAGDGREVALESCPV
jgi:hypothetical protein